MMPGLLPLYPSVTMIPPPPTGRPRGGLVTKNSKKNSLPGVSRRGPEAGVFRIEDDFHGSRVNRIDSCLFIHSRKSGKLLLPPFQDLKKSIV